MQAMPIDAAKKPEPKLAFGVKVGGVAARTLVIIALAVLTAKVASPQIEHLWTLQETPDDLIRVALGFALCVWCVINLFILPKDAEAYRTWIYIAIFVLPFALLCAFVAW
jgi:Ca2+/Na+ antiporter